MHSMMPAPGIVPRDALAQSAGVAVALGDENGARARQVRRRFAQRAARQQMLIAERLLAIDQHDVAPPPAQFPILKSVVQQQRVAAKFLDRVTPALHAVLVHQHDHVLEIGREHVRLVAGGFRIEQQRFAIRHDARRRACHREKAVLLMKPLRERRRLRAIAAREDRHGAALVLQFAREFFHDRRLARAADGQVADRDHLHAERGVAQDAHVVEKPPHLHRHCKNFREQKKAKPHHSRFLVAPLLGDDFQDERLDVFRPDADVLTHEFAQCAKACEVRARIGVFRFTFSAILRELRTV